MVGIVFEGLSQRCLVAGGHQAVDLRLGGSEPFDELGHSLLGEGADEAIDDLAVLQGVDRGNRLDLEGGRDLGVLVNVDLDEIDPPVGGADHLLDDRPQRAARSAPRRPQVHDDRNLRRPVEDGFLEGGVGDVDHVLSENGRGPARIPTHKVG